MKEGRERRWEGVERERDVWVLSRLFIQEASRNADELLKAEEKEKKEAEKRKQKNKKVSFVIKSCVSDLWLMCYYTQKRDAKKKKKAVS